jgi:hypothetical protein
VKYSTEMGEEEFRMLKMTLYMSVIAIVPQQSNFLLVITSNKLNHGKEIKKP